MRGIFGLYVSNDDPSTEEFNRLLDEMEETIWDTFDDDERELVEMVTNRHRLIKLYPLEGVLCRTRETISGYRTGRVKIKRDVMYAMRMLHTLVTSNPNLARIAVLDNIERIYGMSPDEVVKR